MCLWVSYGLSGYFYFLIHLIEDVTLKCFAFFSVIYLLRGSAILPLLSFNEILLSLLVISVDIVSIFFQNDNLMFAQILIFEAFVFVLYPVIYELRAASTSGYS